MAYPIESKPRTTVFVLFATGGHREKPEKPCSSGEIVHSCQSEPVRLKVAHTSNTIPSLDPANRRTRILRHLEIDFYGLPTMISFIVVLDNLSYMDVEKALAPET